MNISHSLGVFIESNQKSTWSRKLLGNVKTLLNILTNFYSSFFHEHGEPCIECILRETYRRVSRVNFCAFFCLCLEEKVCF